LYKIERKMFEASDRLVFTMPGGADYVREIGLDPSKADYINNGIVLKNFYNDVKNNNFIDEDLSNPNIFKVVFTGAIGRANDLGRFIRAFEIIKKEGYDDIKFLIFGDRGEKEELEAYCKEKGIENVIFKGRVNKSEVPSILTQSDLQVLSLANLPSLFKYGLSPNKLFEYLAAGKPVISNGECGYDLLEENKCGKTVKGDSIEDMANGILFFYDLFKNNREEYDVYCENALNLVKEFDFSVLTDRLEDTFRKIK